MSSGEVCHAYELTPEQVMAVKELSQEQVHYITGYADALENGYCRWWWWIIKPSLLQA
jgi:hypothetical protein